MLPLKPRKSNSLPSQHRQLEKEEPKAGKRKEIRKIKAEISQIENMKTEKMN
jgi:hypothetical protein